MKWERAISLLIAISLAETHGFSIDSAKGNLIALHPYEEVVSETTQYLPLGWPFRLECAAAAKLKELNVKQFKDAVWSIRNNDTKKENVTMVINAFNFDRKDIDTKNNTLFVKRMTAKMHASTLECRVRSHENKTLVARYLLQVQDCEARSPPDSRGVNLHNPCGYGVCYVKEQRVFCGCFRLYTGLTCQHLKPWGLFWYFSPILIAIGGIIVIWICLCIYDAVLSKRKKEEQPMEISKSAGFSDRTEISFEYLFKFQRRIRACRYDSDEDFDQKAAVKRKDAEDKEVTKEVEEVSDAPDASSKGFHMPSKRHRKKKAKTAKKSKEKVSKESKENEASKERVEKDETVDNDKSNERTISRRPSREAPEEVNWDQETSQSVSLKGPVM